MEQGLVPNRWLNRKIVLLEQEEARKAAYEQPDYQWNFRVTVSCPPSTIIHVRGGRVWGEPDAGNGVSWYAESDSYDLADFDDTGYNYTFTNAYYYKAFGVLLRWYGNPDASITYPLYPIPTLSEYATAAEVENLSYPPWPGGAFRPDAYYGQPLAMIVIRNNGNTSQSNQFMPIDPVNRGRSYIWRNIKVRYIW